MTPIETMTKALRDCYGPHLGISDTGFPEDAKEIISALRSAGFAIVPVEPTDADLIKDVKGLLKQATEERSHYYTAWVLRRVLAELTMIRAAQETT